MESTAGKYPAGDNAHISYGLILSYLKQRTRISTIRDPHVAGIERADVARLDGQKVARLTVRSD